MKVRGMFFDKIAMGSKILGVFLVLLHVLFLASCGNQSNGKKIETTAIKSKAEIKVPDFNADSAYWFVSRQLEFGPRVPGSTAHQECARWLESTLKRFSPQVMVQPFKTRIYDNRIFDGQNIIAAFNPEIKSRIFLSAHWDSRPYADHDPDPANHQKPIDGANDGASGVGVLLEIARQLSLAKPSIGVDIILFDLEDYGPPQDKQTQATETWGLGSQYWARNLHVPAYSPRFGILLDMVGAPDAVFPVEGFSAYYAEHVVKKVWKVAETLGYGDIFVDTDGGYITDDHYFINQIAQIPTIDIIHLDHESVNGTFYDHWHTVNDNLSQIDRETLGMVGQVVLTVVFWE